MQPEDRIRLRHLREAATKAITYSEGKQRIDLDDELLQLGRERRPESLEWVSHFDRVDTSTRTTPGDDGRGGGHR